MDLSSRFCPLTFQERKVIRFRKSLPDDVPPDGGKQRVEREVKFVRFVASCFLGPYTQIPEILRYDMKDIVRLSEAIRPLRPGKIIYLIIFSGKIHTNVFEIFLMIFKIIFNGIARKTMKLFELLYKTMLTRHPRE